MSLPLPTSPTPDVIGVGILTVALGVLSQVFQLPPGIQIIDVERDLQDRWQGTVQFLLQGPGLPPVVLGGMAPKVNALLERTSDGVRYEFKEAK